MTVNHYDVGSNPTPGANKEVNVNIHGNNLSDECLLEIDEMWIEYYDEMKRYRNQLRDTRPDFQEYKQRRQEIVEKYV